MYSNFVILRYHGKFDSRYRKIGDAKIIIDGRQLILNYKQIVCHLLCTMNPGGHPSEN